MNESRSLSLRNAATKADIETTAGVNREIVICDEDQRPYLMDGETIGGHPLKKLSDPTEELRSIPMRGPSPEDGETWVIGEWLGEDGLQAKEIAYIARKITSGKSASHASANINTLLQSELRLEQVYGVKNLPIQGEWNIGSTKGAVFGFSLNKSDVVSAFRILAGGLDAIDKFSIKIFSRKKSSVNDAAPSIINGDNLEDEFFIDNQLAPNSSLTNLDIERELFIHSDKYYFLEVVAFNSSEETVSFSTAINSMTASLNQNLAGYYKSKTTENWLKVSGNAPHVEVFSNRVENYSDEFKHQRKLNEIYESALGNSMALIDSDNFNKKEILGNWVAGVSSGWGVVRSFSKSELLHGVEFFLNNIGNSSNDKAVKCRLNVYEGDSSIDNTNFQRFQLITSYDQDVTINDNDTSVYFKIGKNVNSGKYYVFTVEAFNDADLPVKVGCANANDEELTGAEVGFYYSSSSNRWITTTSTSVVARTHTYAPNLNNKFDQYSDEFKYQRQLNEIYESALGNSMPLIDSDNFNEKEILGNWVAGVSSGWGVVRSFSKSELLHGVEFFLNNIGNSPNNKAVKCRFNVYEGDSSIDNTNFQRFQLITSYDQDVTINDNDTSVYFKIGKNVNSGKYYVFTVEAFNDADLPVKVGCANANDEGLTGAEVGFYYSSSSNRWITATSTSVVARTHTYAPDLNNKFDEVLNKFHRSKTVLASRQRGRSQWNSGSFDAWAVGVVPTTASSASNVTFFLDNVINTSGVILTIYERLDIISNKSPAKDPTDNILLKKEYSLSELNAVTAEFDEYNFNFGELKLTTDRIYIFKVEAIGGFIGTAASLKDVAEDEHVRRGFYSTDSSDSMFVVSGPSSTDTIAFELYGSELRLNASANNTVLHPNFSLDSVLENRSIDIPEIKVDAAHASITVPGQNFVVRIPFNEMKSTKQTLIFDDSRFYSNQNVKTEYRYIRNIEVFLANTATELVAGVDYDFEENGACVFGLKDIADFDVDVNYQGYCTRYDLIECDPITGALNYVEGIDRVTDSEEYLPEGTAGFLPLFRIFIYADQVQIIPLYDIENGIKIGYENEFYKSSRQNKAALTNTFKRLESGQNLVIAGYGDSITAQGGGDWRIANGGGRDKIGYFINYPTDTYDSIQRFDHSDGLGLVHQHEGWNWHLKAALEARYTSTIEYKNLGIGGTTSSDYVDTENDAMHGGLNPTRLNVLLAENPHLVVIAFGMNELGTSNTALNMINLINLIKANGAEVIVMGCPRINELGKRATLAEWSETNHKLWLAAKHTGSAHLSTEYYQNDDGLGHFGLSAHSLCATNVFNHPGRYELKKIGEALAGIFI